MRRSSGSPIKKFFSKPKPRSIVDNDAELEEAEALTRAVVAEFEQYIKLNKKVPSEVLISVNQIDDAGKPADTVAQHLP